MSKSYASHDELIHPFEINNFVVTFRNASTDR